MGIEERRKGVEERRQKEREQRRRAIIEAALQLYVERGVGGSALADVAARVRLSRGVVYFYFNSKDGLLRAIVADGLRKLYRAFSDAADRAGSGLDAIHQIGRTYADFAEVRAGYYRAISEYRLLQSQSAESAAGGDQREEASALEIARLAGQINTLLAHQIRRGQSDGSIRTSILDPQAAGLALWFATAGLIESLSGRQGDAIGSLGYSKESLLEMGLALLRAGLSA